MGKLLFTVGTFLLGSAFKRLLIGAGLGLVSSQVILTLINTYITKAIDNMSFSASTAIQFLGLSGADVAISVLIGALIARATFEASQIGLKKISA